MKTTPEQELLNLNQQFLDAIAKGDWANYEKLCDPSLTCFEPEALGQFVVGMDFHRFFFDLGGVTGPHLTSMCSPNVRIMGDVAVVAYVRLNQRVGADGSPTVKAIEETRIWQKKDGQWRHVHFHRSPVAKT